jgi:hypothetical protein
VVGADGDAAVACPNGLHVSAGGGGGGGAGGFQGVHMRRA